MTGLRVFGILAVVNIPVYPRILRKFLGDREDYSGALAFWSLSPWILLLESVARTWRSPLWANTWEAEVARRGDDQRAAVKLVMAVVSCAALVFGEYSALHFFVPQLVR